MYRAADSIRRRRGIGNYPSEPKRKHEKTNSILQNSPSSHHPDRWIRGRILRVDPHRLYLAHCRALVAHRHGRRRVLHRHTLWSFHRLGCRSFFGSSLLVWLPGRLRALRSGHRVFPASGHHHCHERAQWSRRKSHQRRRIQTTAEGAGYDPVERIRLCCGNRFILLDRSPACGCLLRHLEHDRHYSRLFGALADCGSHRLV